MLSQSTEFELLVKDMLAARLQADISGATLNMVHNKLYKGKSGHDHQIDVSAELTLGGLEMLILTECKYYSHCVGVDDVMEFAYRIQDIGAHKGVLVTTIGFQEGARKIAQSHKITLIKAAVRKSRSGRLIELIASVIVSAILSGIIQRSHPVRPWKSDYKIKYYYADSIILDRDGLLEVLISELTSNVDSPVGRQIPRL